jgi:drug/metabolite transporter (DMT)-like permease
MNGRSPALAGALIALASAVAFGVTTPLVQRLGAGVGPFATASLLYAGAAAVGLASRSTSEAKLRRAHAGRLFAIAVLGAGVGPSLLAWGLARTSGTSASLMLNLEALFTIAAARLIEREHVGRRALVAAAMLAAAGALLVLDRARATERGDASSAIGLVAIGGASLAWALDNTIAKPLSALDPARVVAAKSAAGASLSACAALALGERWPALLPLAGLVAVGATGFGSSLRLYLRAQRVLGAARTASVFACAPFVGAAVALALGEPAGPLSLAAAAVIVLGVALHMTESHAHVHVHDAIEHDHAHRHDDGHHGHVHDHMPEGEHTHVHRHEAHVHAHAHVPDLHHGHRH